LRRFRAALSLRRAEKGKEVLVTTPRDQGLFLHQAEKGENLLFFQTKGGKAGGEDHVRYTPYGSKKKRAFHPYRRRKKKRGTLRGGCSSSTGEKSAPSGGKKSSEKTGHPDHLARGRETATPSPTRTREGGLKGRGGFPFFGSDLEGKEKVALPCLQGGEDALKGRLYFSYIGEDP